MGTRRRVWVPIVGEDGCMGERIWAMGRGDGKSLGMKLQGKYNVNNAGSRSALSYFIS